MKRITMFFLLILFSSQTLHAEGFNRLASVVGARGNPLAGYGLMAGFHNAKSKEKISKKDFHRLLGRLSHTFPKKIDRRKRKIYQAVQQHKDIQIKLPRKRRMILVSSANDSTSAISRESR